MVVPQEELSLRLRVQDLTSKCAWPSPQLLASFVPSQGTHHFLMHPEFFLLVVFSPSPPTVHRLCEIVFVDCFALSV